MNTADEAQDYIGVVNGAEETTTQRYEVVLDEHAVVQLDDILVCRQQLPDGRALDHFGIVIECGSGIEGAKFASDTERISRNTTPGLNYRVVTVQTLRTSPELWMSPEPGARVYRARGAGRDLALFRDQMAGNNLNVGLDATREPVPIDFRFLNGDQGGHASISGISGVATKTSFAMHLLYMMLESARGQQLLAEHLPGTRCIIFNVKGEDLLHLDRENAQYATSGAAEQWAALGVPNPAPFRSVRYNVPPRGADGLQTSITSRGINAFTTFGITPREFVERGLLSYVLDEQESQINFVVEHVRLKLAAHSVPAGNDGALVIRQNPHIGSLDFETVSAHIGTQHLGHAEAGDQPFRTFSDLVTFLGSTTDVSWYPQTAGGTNDAFLRRLFAMGRRLGHLVRCDAEPLVLDRHINVIDINRLHFDAQRFLVGSILDRVWREKQMEGRLPLRFVVLDELNKYAPREGRSPIKEILVDIAARGRSLGVILIGCQQVASGVESAVTDNASINVVGRLKAQHAREYRFLSPELQDRTIRLRPGMMVLEQPSIPVPLPMTFPLAPFATNRSDDPLGSAGDAARVADDVPPAELLV